MTVQLNDDHEVGILLVLVVFLFVKLRFVDAEKNIRDTIKSRPCMKQVARTVSEASYIPCTIYAGLRRGLKVRLRYVED